MTVLQVTSCGRRIDLAIAQALSLTLNDEGMGDSISVPVCDGTMTITSRDFSPLYLFQSGEQGVWFDPSDFSTMSQDDAGATPVTAVEQAVGRILDKSGRGNHATQATPTSRPILRARYNLVTYSEEIDNAAWTKGGVSVSSNATTAPDGTLTADKIAEDASTGYHRFFVNLSSIANVVNRHSVYLKASERRYVSVSVGTVNSVRATFDLQTGTVSGAAATSGSAFSSPSASITNVGNGWYRCEVSGVPSSTGTRGFVIAISNVSTNPTDGNGASYTGTLSSGVFVWGVDIRMGEPSSLPVYQRIAAATDYDTSGFPPYLAFDGTDDGLATASIDFSTTDAISVFSGLRKISDAARGTVVELTASAAANNGAFHLTAPNAASATYAFESKGTALTDAVVSSGVTAPITSVLTAQADISADQNILRVNGAQVDSDTGNQGTGNYSNAAIYIGRRGGSSLPLNARLYSLIVLGRTATAAEITSTEGWVNSMTKAY